MKTACAIALVAGLAVPVLAAPQESVTFTNVGSFNRAWTGVATPDAANQSRTATFTGTYAVKQMKVTGNVTPSVGVTTNRQRDHVIMVTSPAGNKFLIAPFTGGTNASATINVPANSFTWLPNGTEAANSGTWTFYFHELADDSSTATPTLPDASWGSVTITLDDADATAPAVSIPANPSTTFGDIFSNVSFSAASGWPSVSWSPTQNFNADTVVLSGLGTAVWRTDSFPTTNVTANSGVGYMLARVTPPGGVASGWAPIYAVGAASSASATFFPLGVGGTFNANAGPWLFEFSQNFASATAQSFHAHWKNFGVSLASSTPPALNGTVLLPGSGLVGALPNGQTQSVTGTFPAAPTTVWYKFVIPAGMSVDRAAGTALDINMIGTNLTPENDTTFALWGATGNRIATSFNTGPGVLPQFSFGQGIRNSDGGDGVPYDGSNPGGAPPNNFRPVLAAGDYYLSVCNGDDGVLYRVGLYNLDPTTELNAGPYTINFRSWLTPNTTTFDVPVADDLGIIPGGTTSIACPVGNGPDSFQWVKFTISADANDTTGKYVDIDTANTNDPMNDTNIALYDSTGALKSSNDDIAAGWAPPNFTGGNSAMSFGMGSTPRSYIGINTNMPDGDGRDGTLVAGTYYLQTSMCCANYQATRFWVVNDYVTNIALGNIAVHIRTNYPYGCSIADVGAQGGVQGHDNLLNNDDFVVFINLFFASHPLADVGAQGGVDGNDAQWNNDDFVVFINHFFNDAAGCTGTP